MKIIFPKNILNLFFYSGKQKKHILVSCSKYSEYIKYFVLTIIILSGIMVPCFATVEIQNNYIYYNGPGKNITIAGTWNNWNMTSDKLINISENRWKYSTVTIPAGEHKFKIIIDGQWEQGEDRRITIKRNNSKTDIPNKTNQSIKNGYFTYKEPSAKTVSIAGEFNEWKADANPMEKDSNGVWSIKLNIPNGQYAYKFVINGDKWITDPNNPNKKSTDYGDNSIVYIKNTISPEEKEKMRKEKENFIVCDYKSNVVQIAGTWTDWKKVPMKKKSGKWVYAAKNIPAGQHQYKFIKNENDWDGGDNKILFIDENHKIYVPLKIITRADIESFNEVTLTIKKSKQELQNANIKIPGLKIISQRIIHDNDSAKAKGYYIEDKNVVFIFYESVYGINLKSDAKVSVAGSFNEWKSNELLLTKDGSNSVWKLSLPVSNFNKADENIGFKFIVNDNWLDAPATAKNLIEVDGYTNLHLKFNETGISKILLRTSNIDLSKKYKAAITGISKKTVTKELSPGRIFQLLFSNKKLGTTVSKKDNTTIFRIFAPRAKWVRLHLYDKWNQPDKEPAESYSLKRNNTGVWEIKINKYLAGKYYRYTIDGPDSTGDDFNKNIYLMDPYADAVVNHDGKNIVIDYNKKNKIFSGWTDQNRVTPFKDELTICELHVRDYTSLTNLPHKKKFLGLIETIGTGYGLDHLKKIGINTIELLPIQEFDNDYKNDAYHWGYMTSNYFSPESSYGTNPKTGAQVWELKKLINRLHSEGFAVIIDVVYNHVGGPNHYRYIDNKYYFRFKGDAFVYQNNSGCGNDFKTENPMSRKLIIDSLAHYMKEYHIDGFRFDLAALIDLETLRKIEDVTKKINPNVILIAEPWAMGVPDIKGKLNDKQNWSYWNDDFRNRVKGFAHGHTDFNQIKQVLGGSKELWADKTTRTVNYVESHDDMSLADELTENPKHDGRKLTDTDIKRNKLCAIQTFLSLGIPMISEGQEFGRSKHGINNSYNKGDEINGIDWNIQQKNQELSDYYKNLILLRTSQYGRAFTYPYKPSDNFIKFFQGSTKSSIGYKINADGSYGNYRFIVLLNGDQNSDCSFDVHFGNSHWIKILNETVIDPTGIEQKPYSGTEIINVPKISSIVFMVKN